SSTADCKRNAIVLSLFDDQLTICATHLSAYKSLDKRRAAQLKELSQYLPRSSSVILGDLNLHTDRENVAVTNSGYYDLWQSTKQDPYGYTWDSTTNKLINNIFPWVNRKMRLDRIIMTEQSDWRSE